MNLNCLNKVFQNTTNSYKYYWWLSLIEICVQEKKVIISFEEVILKIISKIWYPVNYYKLSFGKFDQCSRYVKEIKHKFNLEDNLREELLFTFLIEHKNSSLLVKVINELTRYVPYRFVRPWYYRELRGLKDSLVNNKLIHVQSDLAPYLILEEAKKIKLNDNWFEWILENYILIQGYTKLELIKYLEKENPNISNLSLKIEKPLIRNLSAAKKYWGQYIHFNINSCDVFEDKPFISHDKLSIDHFFPWSFLTHDLLWNLHPVSNFCNSSKNNFLPSKEYFESFFELQYKFSRFLISKALNRPLADYYNLYKCSREGLSQMSIEIFKKKMYSNYTPLYELAKNMGFNTGWTLK